MVRHDVPAGRLPKEGQPMTAQTTVPVSVWATEVADRLTAAGLLQ